MQYFKQPDLETPKYKVWKRTAVYQVSVANSENFNLHSNEL